jgi:two-component system cell cycle response regulator DivK
MALTTDITTWRVLIVDDEPDNLNLASDFLELSGAQTIKAVDGQAGLDLVDSFRPNLILLDLDMPIMDGWEMHHQLRLRPDLKTVPIIALTALAMPTDSDRVYAAGFDGYITKPFRVKYLLESINTCIEKFERKCADVDEVDMNKNGSVQSNTLPSA